MIVKQFPLPGLGDYVCAFQCLKCKLCPGVCSPPDLSACPYLQCLCPANDWDLWDEAIYPEHFWWRLEHLTEDQEQQLMEPGDDMMIITPDCLDQFYSEPEPLGQVLRCPRCLSTAYTTGYPDIKCADCGYDEPLIDFPVSESFYEYYSEYFNRSISR